MKKLKISWIFCLAYWFLCQSIPMGTRDAYAQPTVDKYVQWVVPIQGFGQRAYRWPLDKTNFLLQQPISLRLAKNPTGILSLKLVHSGYTQIEPDGPSALLSATVEKFEDPLTQSEKDSLKLQGMKVDTGVEFKMPTKWFLDIELPASPTEEQRIRHNLSLPMDVGTIPTSIPIQVKWKGVNGQTLYDWLTKDGENLVFVLRGNATAVAHTNRVVSLSDIKFGHWWNDVAGTANSISWKGSGQPLVVSLISAGCLAYMGDDTRFLSVLDAPQEIQSFGQRVELLAPADSKGVRRITRDKLLQIDWNASVPVSIEVPIELTAQISPGNNLLSNPSLVKDLSGNGIGLLALTGH